MPPQDQNAESAVARALVETHFARVDALAELVARKCFTNGAGTDRRAWALITQSRLVQSTALWKYGSWSRTAAAVRGVLREFAGIRGTVPAEFKSMRHLKLR